MTLATHTLGTTNLDVSRVGLGTVEIGIPYGIENRLPSDQEADRILKESYELGITYFDTARGYGVAEERIGASGIGTKPGVVIGTKCAQFLEQGGDPRGSELERRVRDEVAQSLRALRADSLQLLQLHGGTAEQIKRGELIELMHTLKDEGLIQHVGIAVRGEEAAHAAIDSDFFATIQLAHSILDQRMAAEVLPAAQAKSVGIINRSVLLRGALTPAGQSLPEELAPLKVNARAAQEVAEQLGTDLPSLALRFVLANNAVSTALIGTFTPDHIRSAIAAVEARPLPDDAMTQLQQLGLTDPAQVDPAHWPKT